MVALRQLLPVQRLQQQELWRLRLLLLLAVAVLLAVVVAKAAIGGVLTNLMRM